MSEIKYEIIMRIRRLTCRILGRLRFESFLCDMPVECLL